MSNSTARYRNPWLVDRMLPTPSQILRARKLLNLTVVQLSEAAGVSRATVTRIESGRSPQKLTLHVLAKSLEAAGADFLIDGRVMLKSPRTDHAA